ncbi:MAG: hypothetical protein J2P20_10500 [Pseudonocardia sp.]|nr:hypothetical protein [Pseudonocardia sp.]
MVRRELGGVLLPGENLEWREPGFVPNTEGSVCGYAEAYGAGVAAEVRRVLFAAYWIDGADIGSLDVLRRRLAGPIPRGHSPSMPLRDFGYAVSPSRSPITTGAWLRIRDWREQWTRLGGPRLPALVRDGAAPDHGAEALRRLADEVARLDAPLNLELPDPELYSVPPAQPRWW